MTKKLFESKFVPETNARGLNVSEHWTLTKEGFVSSGAEQPTIAELRNPHCGEKPTIAQLGIHNPQFHMLWRTYNHTQ